MDQAPVQDMLLTQLKAQEMVVNIFSIQLIESLIDIDGSLDKIRCKHEI